MQVSGLKYTIDATIPSTVQNDEAGGWDGPPVGGRRKDTYHPGTVIRRKSTSQSSGTANGERISC